MEIGERSEQRGDHVAYCEDSWRRDSSTICCLRCNQGDPHVWVSILASLRSIDIDLMSRSKACTHMPVDAHMRFIVPREEWTATVDYDQCVHVRSHKISISIYSSTIYHMLCVRPAGRFAKTEQRIIHMLQVLMPSYLYTYTQAYTYV